MNAVLGTATHLRAAPSEAQQHSAYVDGSRGAPLLQPRNNLLEKSIPAASSFFSSWKEQRRRRRGAGEGTNQGC